MPESSKTMKTDIRKYLSLALILATFIVAVVRMFDAGDIVLHYNFAGEADWHGSRWAVIALPLVSLGLYALLRYYERHPEKYNFPFSLRNREKVYSVLNAYNRWLGLLLSALLLYITLCASGYLLLNLLVVYAVLIVIVVMMAAATGKAAKCNKA